VTVRALPYGSWPTPITSELAVRSARLPNGLQSDGGDVWWSESRPEEGGRNAILRLAEDGSRTEVLPEPWNARTGVHEYGGGAWWVRDGVLWFADWASQRLHRLAFDGDPNDLDPVAITPEPEVPRGLRYADGDVSPDGSTLVCVLEEHPAGGGPPANTIVRLDAAALSTPQALVVGPDFVSNPRWRPDGQAICWIEWDHPEMPWDATRLIVGELGDDGTIATRTLVAGDEQREAICQATWAADGSLWFSTDRTGFWSLHRWTPEAGVELVLDLGQDIGQPAWVFGQASYAILPSGRVLVVHQEGGLDQLSILETDGSITPIELGATSIEWLRAHGEGVVLVAASPVSEPHLARLDLEQGRADALVLPRDLGVGTEWWSIPEAITFPTGDGARAHALLYPPTNPDCTGPDGERPPLLVVIHGGPTAASRPFLRLAVQYWTSRGFAVADVNYRGSSGFGRAYRDLLRGQWGVADVEDCVAVVRHLAERGVVDPARCCIRGGSAGGFTTLAALAFHDAFAAGASHYGVADLAVLAEETHKFEARYLDGLVAPWPEGRAVYDERSPIRHLDGIEVPLAVFQGLDDKIVPPNQSEMVVDGLRSRGVPVAYVAFEGEGHGFRQAANIRASMDGELSFYAQVLGFDLPEGEGIAPIEIR
jgi:dipeptidyl aminopeptidase/acylaminoacyl peptidase